MSAGLAPAGTPMSADAKSETVFSKLPAILDALRRVNSHDSTISAQITAEAGLRALVLPTILLGSGYLIINVLLDWISYIEPYAQLAITPWNPNTGASFTLILIFGSRMIPFLFIAPLLGDLVVRQLPLPPVIEMSSAVVIGGVYATAGLLLLHPKLGFRCGG